MEKKAVVWVSTVLYILISLAILGIVLAAVQPRINAARDKASIEQTVNMLNDFDQKIIEVDSSAEGNVRSLNLQMKKGLLNIDPEEDKIIWELADSSYKYSEPDIEVNIGRIIALTKETADGFIITLTLDYSDSIDLVSEITKLQAAETSYSIFIMKTGDEVKIYSG
jgi:type II secretory pathway pseudopilin PulG